MDATNGILIIREIKLSNRDLVRWTTKVSLTDKDFKEVRDMAAIVRPCKWTYLNMI